MALVKYYIQQVHNLGVVTAWFETAIEAHRFGYYARRNNAFAIDIEDDDGYIRANVVYDRSSAEAILEYELFLDRMPYKITHNQAPQIFLGGLSANNITVNRIRKVSEVSVGFTLPAEYVNYYEDYMLHSSSTVQKGVVSFVLPETKSEITIYKQFDVPDKLSISGSKNSVLEWLNYFWERGIFRYSDTYEATKTIVENILSQVRLMPEVMPAKESKTIDPIEQPALPDDFTQRHGLGTLKEIRAVVAEAMASGQIRASLSNEPITKAGKPGNRPYKVNSVRPVIEKTSLVEKAD